jgi:hypothetical protein
VGLAQGFLDRGDQADEPRVGRRSDCGHLKDVATLDTGGGDPQLRKQCAHAELLSSCAGGFAGLDAAPASYAAWAGPYVRVGGNLGECDRVRRCYAGLPFDGASVNITDSTA